MPIAYNACMGNFILLGLMLILVVFGGGYLFTKSGGETGEYRNAIHEAVNFGSSTVLDLSNKNLTDVPNDVFNRRTLVELNLSHNLLDGALQAEVRHLQNLKVLNLSNNRFTGIPAEIGQLGQLEVLDVSHNNITGLPLELGNLKNLKVLNLSGNDFSEYDLEKIQAQLPATTEIIR